MMITAEKRADSVIRWLERMKKSYRSGHIETAMMDAECARADLEDFLRNSSTFDAVRHRTKPKGIFLMTRAAVLAILIVLTEVMPLARDEVPVSKVEVVETVTQSPAAPLVVQEHKVPPVPQRTKRPQPAKPDKKPAVTKDKPVQVQTKSVAYDKLSSLVQTGKKALQNKK